MSDELTPASHPVDAIVRCPFCGCEHAQQHGARLVCQHCTAMGPPALTTTDEKAVAKKWNHRFDGRYGITAWELEQQLVARLKEWAIHFSPDNQRITELLDTVDRRPLTQTVTGILNQLM